MPCVPMFFLVAWKGKVLTARDVDLQGVKKIMAQILHQTLRVTQIHQVSMTGKKAPIV